MFMWIIGGMFLVLGLLMVFAPKMATKAELRESPEALKKMKRNGILVTIFALLFFVIATVLYFV